MMKEMTQKERLDFLVEEFKEDSVQYRNLETPMDTEGKKRIRENGIVALTEIPTIADADGRL